MPADPAHAPGTAPRHVLVTGHTGFLGGHLTRRLRRDGVRVSGASRAQGQDILRDPLHLDGVDHVYHLGGQSFVPDSWKDPVGYHLANAHGAVRVLDQCRRAGASMTFVSTYVYGKPDSLPVSESAPIRPTNPYAFSKVAAEDACRFYASAFGMEVSILRLFNAYGPGQADSFLIPTIARQVLDESVEEIVVADLAPRRDFVHVDDVVEALLLAPGLPPGVPFNVGHGQSRSVSDVIEACLAAAAITKPYRDSGVERPGEIADVVADISAITAACGWRPRIDFATGVKTMIEAMRAC